MFGLNILYRQGTFCYIIMRCHRCCNSVLSTSLLSFYYLEKISSCQLIDIKLIVYK